MGEAKMLRTLLAVLAVIVTLAAANPAQAAWGGFWQRVRLDFQRVNCWPEPFIHADWADVRAFTNAMVANGWRAQNTLGTHYFDPDTQLLNQAGQLKLRWILTQAPPERRTVFVLRATTPDANAARMKTVQEHVAAIVPEEMSPPVVQTDVEPRGRSGAYIFAVDSMIRSSIPAPRLPERQESNGSN